MFYDQLIKICKERNVKPTPLLRSLGLSATNLKRWQNGSTVNSDILMMLSDYFSVSVDYFFEGYSGDNSKNTEEKIEGFYMKETDKIFEKKLSEKDIKTIEELVKQGCEVVIKKRNNEIVIFKQTLQKI